MDHDNNAISEDGKCESFGETFNIHENTCYGEVTHTANKREEKCNYYNYCYSKVIIMVFVIVFALLLGTAGACVAFALQIVTLKSELQMASSFQNAFMDTLEHLEEAVHLQNELIQFSFQQLSTNLTGELNSGKNQLKEVNSSINQLDEVVTNRLDSILDRLEFPELYTPQPQCGDGFWKQVAYQGGRKQGGSWCWCPPTS